MNANSICLPYAAVYSPQGPLGGEYRAPGSLPPPSVPLRHREIAWSLAEARKEFWRRRWHPTPVLLPRISHGWRSLVGCSPWGHEELDTTERLHFHFSLSCTGEGNGNPLQYSCLENPRDGSLVSCRLWGCTELDTTDVT